jgi:4-amino-4-deoxy-L-arabinose transferase-like glycosyltransferase
LFFLVKKLLGPRVAWSAVVLMVSKPYFLAFTRMGYNNIQPLLPITVGLWLLVGALQGYSHVLAYLSGIALGIASLTYTAGYVGSVIAVLFLLLLLTMVRAEKPLRHSMTGLALCLGIGWLFAAGPFFLGGALSGNLMGGKGAESFFGSAFYGEALFSPDQLTRLYPLQHVGQHRIFFEPRLYALLVVRGVLRTGLSFVADKVATQHYLVGPLAGPGTIFFLAGLAWALRRLRRWQAALWIIWTLSCVLLLSVFNTFPPRATHLVPIIPALAVLTAVGIWSLSGLLRRILRCLWADWVAVGLTVTLALWGLRIYFTVMPQRYVPDLQNVMFWRAQEMGPGSNLVFVADTPYPAGFTLRDIDEFRLGVDHYSLTPDQVDTTDFRALCGHVDDLPDPACRVFFLPGEDADAVEAELRRQLGGGTVQTHTDAAGWLVGLEFVPEYSRSRPQSGFWQSDLYWNGLWALGALVAILLSPIPVRALYIEALSHVSRATTAIGALVVSLRNRWASRMVPALYVGCLGCAILGQAYFARDFLAGRQEPGPNLGPGLFFYALSIVYFLLLGEMIQVPAKTGKNASVLPTFSPLQPKRRRTHSAELGIVLLLIVVTFVLRVYTVGSIPMDLRMLAVLAGTASVLLTYLLARQLLGRQTAFVSAFFLAAQHYHLHFSRLGSNYIFDTLFTPLLAYLLVRGLQKQRPGLFAAAGLTLGVAQYSSPGARMLPVLVVIVVAYLALVRRDWLRTNLANLGVLGLGAILASLPLGMYEAGLYGEGNESLLGRAPEVSIFHSGWLVSEVQHSGRSALQILGDGFLRSSLAFNYFTDRSHWYGASIPFLDPVSAVLFVVGLIAAMRHVSRNVGYFLLVAWFWLAVILAGMLTILPPASERLVIVTPALAMLVALGFTQLVECGKIVAAWFVPVSRVFPFLVTVILMSINVGYYFLNYAPARAYGSPTTELTTRLSRENDLSFVDTSRKASFVFLPGRLDELDVVR